MKNILHIFFNCSTLIKQIMKHLKHIYNMSTNQLKNHCLHLRPHELCDFIYTIKVLKKHNKLEKSNLFETVLTDIFKHTPYPFSWKINYHNNNSYTFLHREKKVLFTYDYLYEKNLII